MLQEAADRSNNVRAGALLLASATMSGLCTWFEKVHRDFGHMYSKDFFSTPSPKAKYARLLILKLL